MEGSDFTLRNKNLTFQPNVTSVPLNIDIIRDEKAESPEIFVIQMKGLDDNLVVIGGNNTAKFRINDNYDNG
jgi:hypothetical protein